MPLGEFTFISYTQVDSTQTSAARLLDAGHKVPFIIKADHQTAGFGKYNRKWYSLNGDIAITIAITPACDEKLWPMLTYVAALSVGELIADVTYKWPNDVMIGNKKLSGILLQKYKDYLLIGIGVNVIRKDGMISISELGYSCADSFLLSIIENFKLFYNNYILNGFSYIRPKWLSRAGSVISSRLPGGRVIDGVLSGIDDDGALLVTNDGVLNKIYAADTQLIHT